MIEASLILFLIQLSFWLDFVKYVTSVDQPNSKNIYYDVSKNITKKYRRFELTIGNLILTDSIKKYCIDETKLKDCQMVVTIDFNNIKHSRNINLESEYDKEDGIYLFHSIVWNGDEDELKVFTEKTTLNIKIYITNNDSHNEVYSKIHTNIVKSASNTERKIDINLSDTENFQIFVSYRCMGYTGFNCQFECDQENYDIECDYETGLAFCKNRSLFNPPFCNLEDSCPEDEKKKCQNNGKCVKLAENWYDCICQRGYGGKNCEFFYCVPPCNADYENCTGPNICSCLNKNKTIPFCNITTCAEDSCEHGGKCKIRYNAIICMCNTSKYAGQFCEKECPKPCLYGICSYFKNSIFCDCYDGFNGENCGILTTQLTPIFEKGYISPRNQKIAYVAVSSVAFITSCCIYGIGVYIQNKTIRKLKAFAEIHNRHYSATKIQNIPQDNENSFDSFLMNNTRLKKTRIRPRINHDTLYADLDDIYSNE